jgi:curli production assembly/transport component CsgF
MVRHLAFGLLLALYTWGTVADELVYAPVNPSFVGGSSFNGSWLLSNAQAQNTFKDPSEDSSQESDLEQFKGQLERAILGRLAAAVTSQFIDPNGELKPGTFQAGDFEVSIIDLGGGQLQIITTDTVTGDTTTFEISSNL